MGVEWSNAAIYVEFYESRKCNTLDFILSEKRKKPVHGLSRRGL